MPKKLPHGWTETTLDNVVAPSRARSVPSAAARLPYVGLEHIEAHTMRLLGTGDSATVRSSSVRFEKGDILYGKMRPYLNKVWVAQFDGLCSAEFLVFPAGEGLSGQYVASRLNATDFVNFANHQVSGDRPRVDFDKLAAFRFRLPPAAEQERIVEKLDAILSRVGAGEAAAARALARLKRYRAAVLHAAVTGELTRAWRKANPKPAETGAALLRRLLVAHRARWETDELARLTKAGKKPKDAKWKARYPEPVEPDTTDLPTLPRGWTWASVEQLGFVIGGLTKNPKRLRLPHKLPYLRVANVYADELRLDDVSVIGVAEGELDKLLLEKGDLLVVEGNGSKDQIGRLAVWDGSIDQCVHQNHIIKVRPTGSDLGSWMLRWLLSPSGRHEIERVASSTTGLYTLSVGKVGLLPVPLPPSDEQTQIVRQIEHRLSLDDRLTVALNTALARARLWRQSILQAAFGGKLVLQSATDEPASVLLKKIRAARAALAVQPKPKRGRGGRKTMKPARRELLEVLKETKAPMKPEELFAAAGFDEATVEAFYSELRDLVALKKVREKRDPQDRGFVRLEVRP